MIVVIIATYLLVEQGKGCTIQSLSADQRGQRQSKNPHKKKQRGKRVAYHLVVCHWFGYPVPTVFIETRD